MLRRRTLRGREEPNDYIRKRTLAIKANRSVEEEQREYRTIQYWREKKRARKS